MTGFMSALGLWAHPDPRDLLGRWGHRDLKATRAPLDPRVTPDLSVPKVHKERLGRPESRVLLANPLP